MQKRETTNRECTGIFWSGDLSGAFFMEAVRKKADCKHLRQGGTRTCAHTGDVFCSSFRGRRILSLLLMSFADEFEKGATSVAVHGEEE